MATVPPVSGIADFTIEQGADFRYVLSLTQSSVAVDLTNVTAVRMHIRASQSANWSIIEMTDANSRATVVSPPTGGQILLLLTGAETALITQSGVYDLEVTNNGAIERYVRGKITLIPSVTR